MCIHPENHGEDELDCPKCMNGVDLIATLRLTRLELHSTLHKVEGLESLVESQRQTIEELVHN